MNLTKGKSAERITGKSAWRISLRRSLLRSDSQGQFHVGANLIEKKRCYENFMTVL
jgi:hypothetical protein